MLSAYSIRTERNIIGTPQAGARSIMLLLRRPVSGLDQGEEPEVSIDRRGDIRLAGGEGGRLRWMIEPCGWRWSAIGMLRTRAISRSNMKSTARMLCLIIRNRASGSAAGTTFKRADSSSQARSVLRSGELSAAAICGSLNSYLPMTAYHLTR